jgi:hypothetical protein
MVSVLATGLKVRGLKPSRGDGFLRTIKISSTTFFGGKIRTLVKELYEHRKKYFVDKIHHFLPPVFLDLLLDGSAGMISRELW